MVKGQNKPFEKYLKKKVKEGEKEMNDVRSTLEEKERKLTRYLETHTTEEIINDMQEV